MARESRDPRIASVSIREDAAAAAASKKASQSGDTSSHWPAEMLPPEARTPALPPVERVGLRPGLQAPLASATVRPLLKPPAA